MTAPRWLMPCPLKDRLGQLVEWDLAGAMASGLLELPRGADGGLATLNGHYVEKFLARQPEWRQLREQTGRSFEQLPLGIKRDYGRLRIGLSWMQQGVADSSKTLLAWAPIPLRKLEPCIPSQSSQQNQRLPWISKVDLPPPLDRSVPALVS